MFRGKDCTDPEISPELLRHRPAGQAPRRARGVRAVSYGFLRCGAANGRRRTSSGPAGTRRGSIRVKKSELRGAWEVGGIGDLRLCGEPGFTGTETRRKTPDGASPPSPQFQFLNTNRAFSCSAAPFSPQFRFLSRVRPVPGIRRQAPRCRAQRRRQHRGRLPQGVRQRARQA